MKSSKVFRNLLRALRPGIGLHLKLAIGGTLTAFLCILLVSGLLMYRQSGLLNAEVRRSAAHARKSLIERGALLAQSMGASMESAIAGYDFGFITDTVRTTQERNHDLAYILLTNAAKVIIVHSDSSQVGGRADQIYEDGKPRYLERDDGTRIVEISRPLRVGGRNWGWLVLGFDLGPIQSQANAAIERGNRVMARSMTVTILIGAGVVLLSLGASILISRQLLKPLVQLARDAEDMGSGKLSQEIASVGSADEIGVLARQFEKTRRALQEHVGELLVAKQEAEDATLEEKRLRAQIEEHSRLLESKVRERTAELEATNERLTEYDRLKSEFLSNVSHELRSPLSAISSAAKIISRYSQGDEESTQRFGKIITEESTRLSRLIDDLLDLSKIEAGKTDWNIQYIGDPSQLLERVVEIYRPLYEESEITLELSYESPLPGIHGDRDRLIQVLTNLCSNALKFTPEGGLVRLRACKVLQGEKAMLEVSVSDSGPGIPAGERESVFERFHQGGGPDKPRGTGLGLAICREVVLHHGGSIRAEAAPEGGTRMVIHLPAA